MNNTWKTLNQEDLKSFSKKQTNEQTPTLKYSANKCLSIIWKIEMALSLLMWRMEVSWRLMKTALEISGITDDNFPVLNRWHTRKPDWGGKGWNEHLTGRLWWPEDTMLITSYIKWGHRDSRLCYMCTCLWLSRHLHKCLHLLRNTHTNELSTYAWFWVS